MIDIPVSCLSPCVTANSIIGKFRELKKKKKDSYFYENQNEIHFHSDF